MPNPQKANKMKSNKEIIQSMEMQSKRMEAMKHLCLDGFDLESVPKDYRNGLLDGVSQALSRILKNDMLLYNWLSKEREEFIKNEIDLSICSVHVKNK